jgi:hypothetical protein
MPDKTFLPAGSSAIAAACRDSLDTLAEAIRDKRVILFVGAGVSMNLGLPSWLTLTEHMVDELGLDRSCLHSLDVSYQTVAEYYRIEQRNLHSLSRWLEVDQDASRDKVRQSRLHNLIVELDFPIIYTTNYDRNLETAFEIHQRDYVKINSPHDVARASDAQTQIVKFHGDFDDVDNLVLTESDHFERLSFDSPLDVKFRADGLGKTVLFIGYSMSDMNIRLMLYRLWRTWVDSGQEENRPPSFIFMARPNPVQAAVLCHWGITVLGGEEDDPGKALEDFLVSVKNRVDALREAVPPAARD